MATATGEGPADPSLSVQVIEPTSGWRALDLGEMWEFRDLFRALVVRDVKLRYRQTSLGVVWVILQPLLGAGVFTVVFGQIAKLPSGRLPYFVLALCGTTGWAFFSTLLTRCSTSLINNSSLLTKVFFPRGMLPLSTVGSASLDAAVGLVVVMGADIAYGLFPGWRLLGVLPAMLTLGLLALGPGLLLSAATATYRDVQYILPVVVQFLLYASPVAYALTAVPKHLRAVYDLNPVVAPLEGLRWSLTGQGTLPTSSLISTGVTIVVLLVLGGAVFRRFERRFADVI